MIAAASNLIMARRIRPSLYRNSCRRCFATETKQQQIHMSKPKQDNSYRTYAIIAAITIAGSSSIYTRHIRKQKLSTLTLAQDSTLLSTKYNLPSLTESVKRAGLIGTTKSVKDELHYLRNWHVDRGYFGGIVLRDLSRPLFSLNSSSADEIDEASSSSDDDDDGKNHKIIIDPDQSNRRECYYLYYEIHSNGQTQQQIFCRGTTLLWDVLTCLQTAFVYDEELGCSVHYGFNQHANRIIEDLIPLLHSPGDNLATVEVCGHSLGGAVSMLVAAKLRKRGYNITKCTSLAGPRICRGVREREILQELLPAETIRIEDDLDVVTYLPPLGVSIGDKLWFATNDDVPYFLPRDRSPVWVDYVWLNLRIFESIWYQAKRHRVISYVNMLEKLLNDISSNDDS